MLHRLNIERGKVFEKNIRVLFSILAQRDALALRTGDRFIVNVGNVHGVIDGKTAEFKVAPQQVIEHERAKVADMCIAVDGRPARIHGDGGILPDRLFLYSAGNKFFFYAGQRIGYFQCHRYLHKAVDGVQRTLP